MAIPLSDLKKSRKIAPPKIIVYGEPGVGKTSFALGNDTCVPSIAGAPKPVAIFTEPGLGLIDAAVLEPADDVEGYVHTTYQSVLDSVKRLTEEDHGFQTLLLDSLSSWETGLLHPEICRRNNTDDIEKIGGGFFKWRRAAAQLVYPLRNALDQLQARRRMAIIVTAHVEVAKVEPPDSESYTRYTPMVEDKVWGPFFQWSDACLFAHSERAVAKKDEGFGKKRAVAIGSGKRVMVTSDRPTCVAKNRYSLPEVIEFSWAAFEEHMSNALSNSQPTPVSV